MEIKRKAPLCGGSSCLIGNKMVYCGKLGQKKPQASLEDPDPDVSFSLLLLSGFTGLEESLSVSTMTHL